MNMRWLIDDREQKFLDYLAGWEHDHPQNALKVDPDLVRLTSGDVLIQFTGNDTRCILIENKFASDIEDIQRLAKECQQMAAFRAKRQQQSRGQTVPVPELHLVCSDASNYFITRRFIKIAVHYCQKFNIGFHHCTTGIRHVEKIWKISQQSQKPLNVAQNLTYKPDHAPSVGYALAALIDGVSPTLGYEMAYGCQSLAEVVAKFQSVKDIKGFVDPHFRHDSDVFAEEILKQINYPLWEREYALHCSQCGKALLTEGDMHYDSANKGEWLCSQCWKNVL